MRSKLTAKQIEVARTAQRAYLREWKRRNPEKEREYRQRYWLRKAAEMEKDQTDDKK